MSPVPRYDSFQPASETASRIKRKVRSHDTKPELLLRRALWAQGLRYRLRRKDLPGKPDMVFPRQKVAVFCDGDFWHGRDWPALKRKLQRRANPGYWIPKIEANIARDKRNTEVLEEMGWQVVRLWETDLTTALSEAVALVAAALRRATPRMQLEPEPDAPALLS